MLEPSSGFTLNVFVDPPVASEGYLILCVTSRPKLVHSGWSQVPSLTRELGCCSRRGVLCNAYWCTLVKHTLVFGEVMLSESKSVADSTLCSWSALPSFYHDRHVSTLTGSWSGDSGQLQAAAKFPPPLCTASPFPVPSSC